ncbi:MAG: FAD-binding oxidoreductase [Chloroflexota bacterium]|nr:FAD-binding oxidoreductase [Chloroflexota bacterium]
MQDPVNHATRTAWADGQYELLDAAQTEGRIRVAGSDGSFWNWEGATVQPARLARGLARAVERRGGTIYERTRVADYVPGPAPRLVMDCGDVRARRTWPPFPGFGGRSCP